MNESEKSFNFVCFWGGTRGRDALSSLTVMSTGADRLLRGAAAPVSARPRSSRMKRVSQQRCSTTVQ